MTSAPSELIFLVEESPEGGFTARALGAAIFTQAETVEALNSAVRDAVQCHFEAGASSALWVRLN